MYGQPGYGAPPPVYGYQQPGYGQPAYGAPPAYGFQQPAGPTIIHINNDDNDGTPCQFCGTDTTNFARRTVGTVAIAWGCCLFFSTGFLCCLPCCIDGCKDVELICVKCQNVKSTIPASCC